MAGVLKASRDTISDSRLTLGPVAQAQGWGSWQAPRGAAMTGRTAAYGRSALAWAVKRGTVHTNPFAALPVRKRALPSERVLSDAEIADWNRIQAAWNTRAGPASFEAKRAELETLKVEWT